MQEDFAGALQRCAAAAERAIMLLNVRGTTSMIVATVGVLGMLLTAAGARAACPGDCNNDGVLSAGDVTKIVRIINLCSGAAAGCAAIRGADKQCTNADLNGNSTITVDELMAAIANIIKFPSGCGPTPTPTLTRTGAPATLTPTAVSATATATPTATFPAPTLTPTTQGGPPLGTRVFSLGSASGFFSSLVPTLKAGTPAGTLMLDAGGMDAMGHATVTLTNAPVFVTTSISLGGLTLCTRLDSCTGTLYCNGGANVDTTASLESLKPGLNCVRDGTHSCGATSTFCCSNACEGVCTSPPTPTPGGPVLPTPTPCTNSGNPPVRTSGVNTTDSGAGSALLMCAERIVSVPMVGADCSKADYSTSSVTNELLTTGTSTAKVTDHCAGSGAPATKAVTFSKAGEKFNCAQWTTENGPGSFAFAIPSEEGSAQFTGDGANAGIYSDH